MKLTVAIIASLSARTVHSSGDASLDKFSQMLNTLTDENKNCNKEYLKASGMKYKARVAQLKSEECTEYKETRAFTGSIGKTVRSMNEYGCWCYFGDGHGRGRGQPQDAIDEMCKVLHDGYECAMRDAEEEGTTCVPWEVEYTSAIGGSGTGIAEECSQNNPGSNCAARACTIEGAFVANLLDAFVSGNGIDNSLKHENGFDQQTSCTTKKNGGGPTNKQCCGSYPDRFPFKTAGGDRKCCGNRTFNSLTLKCCDADSSTVKFNC